MAERSPGGPWRATNAPKVQVGPDPECDSPVPDIECFFVAVIRRMSEHGLKTARSGR
ncbi:MAG: hypothetical protein RLZZ461_1026, partial [Planctomycetota bacterium]